MKYLFHPHAKEEYILSADWYKERSPKLEKRFIQNTNKTIDFIVKTPELYRIIKGNKRTAKIKGFPFSVIYVLDLDNVFIISIFHHSRNPKIWKER